MNTLFQQQYRIPSTRLKNWDYRQAGAYFVTICAQDRRPFFGHIRNHHMHLSRIGVIAELCWHNMPYHQSAVTLGAYIIMPNHVHGIIHLAGKPDVETLHARSLQYATPRAQRMSAISPQSASLSAIIRAYKSAVSRHAHRLGWSFAWQARFHDHIIRTEEDYLRISEYILGNPATWAEDDLYCNASDA